MTFAHSALPPLDDLTAGSDVRSPRTLVTGVCQMELWEQSIEARINSAREHVQRKLAQLNVRVSLLAAAQPGTN
jgi:hypothetical protein